MSALSEIYCRTYLSFFQTWVLWERIQPLSKCLLNKDKEQLQQMVHLCKDASGQPRKRHQLFQTTQVQLSSERKSHNFSKEAQ